MTCSRPLVEEVVARSRGLGHPAFPRAAPLPAVLADDDERRARARARRGRAFAPGAPFEEVGSWPPSPFVQAHAE